MNEQQSLNREDFKVLMKERIKNFWGYGNLKSDIWFVGMEEGFNEETEDLYKRFKATEGKQIADVYEDLKIDAGSVKMFEDGANANNTYKPLIFIQIYLKKKMVPTLEQIKEFQMNSFGRSNSENAVLELMPLPSKSIHNKDWLYKETGIKGLESRKEYLEMYKPLRVEVLKKLIEKHKPKLVLFYSKTYMEDWKNIADGEYTEQIPILLQTAKNHDTLLAVVPHPVSQGRSNNDWETIAMKLDELLN